MARQTVRGERVLEVLDVVLALTARTERAIVDEARVEADDGRDDEARIGTALAVLDLDDHVAFMRPRLERRVTRPHETANELLGRGVLCCRVDEKRLSELAQARILGEPEDIVDIAKLVAKLVEAVHQLRHRERRI